LKSYRPFICDHLHDLRAILSGELQAAAQAGMKGKEAAPSSGQPPEKL